MTRGRDSVKSISVCSWSTVNNRQLLQDGRAWQGEGEIKQMKDGGNQKGLVGSAGSGLRIKKERREIKKEEGDRQSIEGEYVRGKEGEVAAGGVKKGTEVNRNLTRRLQDGGNQNGKYRNETTKPLVVALLQFARARFARVAAFKRRE